MLKSIESQEDLLKNEQIKARLAWIRQWAEDRNLILGSNPKAQFVKLDEEIGEIAVEIINLFDNSIEAEMTSNILERMKDGIGDAIVVATIISAQYHQEDSTNPLLNSEYFFIEEPHDVTFKWGGLDNQLNSIQSLVGLMTINTYISAVKGSLAGRVARGKPIHEEVQGLCFWLAHLANCMNWDILECIDQAWNEIKDRKGRMIDGAFVKEEDLVKMGLTA